MSIASIASVASFASIESLRRSVDCVVASFASRVSIASSAEKVGRRLQGVPMDLVNHVLAMGQREVAALVQDQTVIERKGFETDDT